MKLGTQVETSKIVKIVIAMLFFTGIIAERYTMPSAIIMIQIGTKKIRKRAKESGKWEIP